MYNVTKLDNGIDVVTRHMEGVRSFSVGVFTKASSSYEEMGQLGISHLIEHMMFKGTARFSAKQIAETIDHIGGSMNAYTSKNSTVYYAKVLYEHAETAIDLLADMLMHSNFEAQDLRREIDVVKEEIALYQDSPDDVCYENFLSLVYQGHPLATPVLGYAEQIEKITRQDILAYLKAYYSSHTTTISVAGYIDGDVMALLQDKFSDYNQSGRSKRVSAAQFQGGVIHSRKDIEQNHLCLGFRGTTYGSKDHYATLLLCNVLGGTSSALLYQKIREERGLTYSVYAHPAFFNSAGHIIIYTSYKPENEAAIVPLIASCVNSLRDIFNEQTLAQAKTQLKGSYMLALEGSASLMSVMGKCMVQGADLQTLDEIMHAIEAISLDDITRIIARIESSPIALSMVGNFDKAHSEQVYQRFITELERKDDAR